MLENGCGALWPLALACAMTCANAAAPRPAALDRPATSSAQAAQAAMLDVARAGDRLVAVGERGIVLLSDDDGRSFRQAAVPVGVSLTAVQFVTPQTGFAVGHMGVALRSDDAGATWTRLLDGEQIARLAIAAAERGNGDPAAAQQLADDGPDKPLLDLWFANADDGFVVGAFGLALRTRDGGQSWEPWDSHLPNPGGMHLYGIAGDGGSLYVVGEQGLLLRSDDGGESFVVLETPYDGSWFGLVADAGSVIAFGLRGHAYRSVDRGLTWSEIGNSSQTSLTGAAQADDGIYFTNANGEVLRLDADARLEPFAQNPTALTALTSTSAGALVATGMRGPVRLEARGLAPTSTEGSSSSTGSGS